jgi:hypothetical protein
LPAKYTPKSRVRSTRHAAAGPTVASTATWNRHARPVRWSCA